MKRLQGSIILFLILLLLVLSIGTWYQVRAWHEREQQHLAVDLASLKTGYQATINTFALTTETYFSEIINRPAVTDLLAAALTGREQERDLLRGRLYRLLYPSYLRLKSRGLRHLQFHFPNGTSFLRFHRPEYYGDDLSAVQPTVCLVNTMKEPIRGFEVGKSASAFRYVYPIITNGVHLGGVDLSIPIKTLRDELATLAPLHEFAYILDRSTSETAMGDQLALYSESAIHPDFLTEDSGVVLPDSLPPPSAQAQAVNRLLRHDPDFQKRLLGRESFALAITVDNRPLAVSFLRIHDVKDNAVGYLISYAPDPLIATLKTEFLTSLVISWVLMGSVCLLVVLLAHSRERYKRERGELKAISDTMLDGLCVTDRQGRIRLINPAACAILGYRQEDLLGQAAHDSWQCARIKQTVLANGENFSGQAEFETADGTRLPVEIAVAPLYGEKGEITGAVTVFRDISLRLQQEAEMKRLATTDPLTGLANRRCFLEQLEQALARHKRYASPVALLMLDIDFFKKVNDTHGHGVGDEVLRQFADFARRLVREVDLVGRLGGEEFAILLPDTELRGALDLAERLRCAVADKEQNGVCGHAFTTSAGELFITVSIGLTLLAESDRSPDLALNRADTALYRAKERGRNRVELELLQEPPKPSGADKP